MNQLQELAMEATGQLTFAQVSSLAGYLIMGLILSLILLVMNSEEKLVFKKNPTAFLVLN